jgi:hypothetical protein
MFSLRKDLISVHNEKLCRFLVSVIALSIAFIRAIKSIECVSLINEPLGAHSKRAMAESDSMTSDTAALVNV